LGIFVEHLVGAQKLKGLKSPFKSTQPPAKTTRNQPQTVGHSPKMDLCPKSRRKNKKNGKNRKNGFSGKKMGKNEKLANGRPAVGGLTGERPAVVLRWWGRRLVAVG
jgi:hypothetical protein